MDLTNTLSVLWCALPTMHMRAHANSRKLALQSFGLQQTSGVLPCLSPEASRQEEHLINFAEPNPLTKEYDGIRWNTQILWPSLRSEFGVVVTGNFATWSQINTSTHVNTPSQPSPISILKVLNPRSCTALHRRACLHVYHCIMCLPVHQCKWCSLAAEQLVTTMCKAMTNTCAPRNSARCGSIASACDFSCRDCSCCFLHLLDVIGSPKVHSQP